MLFYIVSVLNIIVFGLCAMEKPILPVTTCKRTLTKYHSCLKFAIVEAWPRFVEGLPELDFPSMDPFLFSRLSNIYDINDIHGEILLENMTIAGMKNITFRSVRTRFVDNIFNLIIDTYAPSLKVVAELNAKGSLLEFNIITQGTIVITMEDIKTKLDFIGPVINDTWTIEHFRIFPSIEKMKFHYKSLTEETQAFNDLLASLINSYWPSISRSVWPIIAKSWDEYGTDVANIIFSKVSFSAVFP